MLFELVPSQAPVNIHSARRDQCGSALSALWHVLCNFTLLLWLLLLPLYVFPQPASPVAVRHIPRHQERNMSHGTRAFLRCRLQQVKHTVSNSRTSARTGWTSTVAVLCVCVCKVKGQCLKEYFVPAWKLVFTYSFIYLSLLQWTWTSFKNGKSR